MLAFPETGNFASIVFVNNDATWEFAVDVLRTVFGKTLEEAESFAASVHRTGGGKIGPFPPNVAETLVEAARKIARERSEPLDIRLERLGETVERCSFCGTPAQRAGRSYRRNAALICQGCLAAGLSKVQSPIAERPSFRYTHEALSWHFAGFPKEEITSTTRSFPGHMRPDVQAAVNALFNVEGAWLLGIHEQYRYETTTLSKLMVRDRSACTITQAEFEDMDIGAAEPVKCLRNGLWLLRDGDMPYVAVVSEHRDFDKAPELRIEIATPKGEQGTALVNRSFAFLEEEVHAARSYRGKVISFEAGGKYRGQTGGMTVHRLPPVSREDVILPKPTLALLDRNVVQFVKTREDLRALGQPTRKGILLYGPPGTGKTHTIRYLASTLPGHTTLLITAAQVAKLAGYVLLARLLQPSLVVIEDVDLIARQREQMNGPCEESLLNELLNEMDGLKGDADIVFVLTTNRPEQLEQALSGRPGRIDQAIEIPLPDTACRERLVRLYGGNLELPAQVVTQAARRTEGMSAAFIKELMRRIAQEMLRRRATTVELEDVDQAVEEMLFSGGTLNARLLGVGVA